MNQNELIYLCRLNNEEAFNELLAQMRPTMNGIFYDLVRNERNIDRDEVMQCARIGLVNAIDYYRDDKGMAFNSFATLCMRREVTKGVRNIHKERSYKNNVIVSIDCSLKDHDGLYVADMLADNSFKDTESVALNNILREEIKQQLGPDSKEYQVVVLRMEGYSYNEIADIMQLSFKSVEYHLTKARKKLSYLRDI